VNQRPKPLSNGDVIAIPLVKPSGDYSCFIQVKIDCGESNDPPMKQLIQCKTTKNYFLAYWEEDPDSRYHFSTNIEKVKDPGIVSSSKGYKNLRMAAEVPCPYCGNLHLIFCPECNTFICYDGVAEKVKCPSCRKKYKLKNMKGNIDIQTF